MALDPVRLGLHPLGGCFGPSPPLLFVPCGLGALSYLGEDARGRQLGPCRVAAACTQGRRALEEQILLLEVPCEEEAERLRMQRGPFGGVFGGVTGCCAPGAPAAAPLGAGRTRPTGGGGSMRSAAALGSVFSGSSTSPSSGAAKPMPISLPLSSKPKGDEERARRFGGEAGGAKGCGGTTDAERIRGGGWAGAIAADCHAALEAAAFGAGAAGPSSGAVASACAALACGALPGGALAMRRGAAGGTSAARGPITLTYHNARWFYTLRVSTGTLRETLRHRVVW